MMIAVDRGCDTYDRRKPWDTAHPVAAAAVPFDVLPECAAQKDVDCLRPAADAEDRFAAGGKRLKQFVLLLIPHRVDRQTAVLYSLPEARGMDVAAAGQQQTVAACREQAGIAAAVKYAEAAGLQ